MAAIDEFSLLPDNAAEAGLPWKGAPAIHRTSVDLPDGRKLSALVWGERAPELVLIHGGGQNAHTWDTVALALDRPLVAIDLPGHGHSDWRSDGVYAVPQLADDVAIAVEQLAPDAEAVVGMSLGGATTWTLAARRPDLTRRVVLVDATPGGTGEGGAAIGAFIHGPPSFESLDELVERAVAFNPTRSESSLRRGVIHNTRQREDGRWVWRHHLGNSGDARVDGIGSDQEWDDLSAITAPILLLLGADSTVVKPQSVEEFKHRQPTARIEVVAEAGHSIQGDQPLDLARLVAGFVAS